MFRKPVGNSLETVSVVNYVYNGEECARWGPLATEKKTSYYDQGFYHCAYKKTDFY